MTTSTLRETWLLHLARTSPRLGLLPLVVAFSVLLALSAQVAVPLPFTPVPITLQPLVVLLCGALLGSRAGAFAVGLYLLQGAAGLPVFSGGRGGAAWLLFSPTAGFLWAFPFAAFVCGFLCERGWDKSTLRAMLAMSAGLLAIYAGGWLRLAVAFGPERAFALAVWPFVALDALKIAFAALVLPLGWKFVPRERDPNE